MQQKHTYLTRRRYGAHLIGEKCFAFRVDGGRKLLLEFSDGHIIELPGKYYTESTRDRSVDVTMEDDLIPLYVGNNTPLFVLNGCEIGQLNELLMMFRH